MIEEENRAASLAEEEAAVRKRKRPGGLECRLGLLIGLAGLIASRLGQLWIEFDVFSQFTLQFAVLTVAFLVGLIMPRARLTAAFLLVLTGLLAIGVWPHVASKVPHVIGALKEGQQPLKVASFNTWYDNKQVNAVKAEIERLDADVVTLIELGPNKHAMLGELKEKYPYQVNCFQIDFCNLAILSKFPIMDSTARVEWEGPPMIQAKLGPEMGNLNVFGIHTIRFPHSRAQFRQVQALDRLLVTIPGRKLVMGDFNATPFSRITQMIASETGLTRLTMLPSWPSRIDLPQVAIDHIFVSPEIGVIEDERIGESSGSDHYPIAMKLAVPVS